MGINNTGNNPVYRNQSQGAFSGRIDHNTEFVVTYYTNKDEFYIEILDHTGKFFGDKNFTPDKAAVAIFGLTDDEYKLTENFEQNEAFFAEFAKKLASYVPKDRFKKSGYFDKSLQYSELDVRTKCDTIDDNKYIKYLSRVACKKLRSLDKVYVIYFKNINPNVPMIDPKGCAWVLFNKDDADKTVEKNKPLKLAYRELTVDKFNRFVYSWCRLGITRFLIKDLNTICDVKDYLKDICQGRLNFYNADINYFILKLRQCYEFPENDQENIMMYETWMKLLYENLPGRLFIVPVCFEGIKSDKEDFSVYFNDISGQVLSSVCFFEKMTGRFDRENSNAGIQLKDGNQENVFIGDTNVFYGGEKYRTAALNDVPNNTPMIIKQMKVNDKQYLGIFTDFTAIDILLKDKKDIHFALFTYEQLVRILLEGFVKAQKIAINPGSLPVVLDKQDFKNVEIIANEKRAESNPKPKTPTIAIQ